MDFSVYKNRLPFPERKSSISSMERRVLEKYGATEQLRSALDAQEAYEAALGDWRTENLRLQGEFKRDAFRELGLIGHPKAEAAFTLAWEWGHSAGYSEVFSYLEELAGLLKS